MKRSRSKRATSKRATPRRAQAKRTPAGPTKARRTGSGVVPQLNEIESAGGGGTVELGDGAKLSVSSLDKVFFPGEGFTKGDVMRYYAEVAAAILPVMRDRPLVLKRYPDGIEGQSFYQQKAPDRVPPGVRAETIRNERGERQRRLIGGDLTTLLYIVQLGAISVDPWHSRVPSLDEADFTILDLDPGPRAPFSRVVEVARLVREDLDTLGLTGGVKTSGSSGIHVVVPLERRVSDESAVLAAQLVATRVAARAPGISTVERSVNARPPGAVYIDYLQNIRAKTVAAAYSVRARPGATVSAPLDWEELESALDPRDFTIETMPNRLRRHGDMWGRVLKKSNSIERLLEAAPRKARWRR